MFGRLLLHSFDSLGAEIVHVVREGKTEHIVSGIIASMAEAGIERLPWYPNLRPGERSLQTMFPSDRTVRKGNRIMIGLLLEPRNPPRIVISC